MEDLLKKFTVKDLQKAINLTSTKYSRTIKATSDKSDFRIHFPININLDNDLNYELGLMWFTSYNTIYNITNENNIFNFSKDGGKTFQTIIINPGAYEIKEIDSEIKTKTGLKDLISIQPQISTGKVIMTLGENIQIDFIKKYSLNELLGFEKKVYKDRINISENLAKITNITDINIECDLVNGNYSNGNLDNILYSFPANTVPLGYKFIERMNPPNYLPISRKIISDIHIQIVDQDGKVINFNGEKINLYLHLKQV